MKHVKIIAEICDELTVMFIPDDKICVLIFTWVDKVQSYVMSFDELQKQGEVVRDLRAQHAG